MFRTYVKVLTKWIGIPLILVLIALILSAAYFFNSDISPRILSFNHSTKNVQSDHGVVRGTFNAQENYLSIVTVRFEKKQTFSGDSLFKIKNILDKKWYHVVTIAASQYSVIPFYAFGIPPITNSKNRTYQFEIQLLDNSPVKPTISLSNKYPVLISRYSFPNNILLESKSLMIEFIGKKLSYYAFKESSWKIFLVYSIPLILYVLYITLAYRVFSLEQIKLWRIRTSVLLNPYMLFIFLCIGIDIFIIRKYSDGVTVLFTFLWILGAVAYRLEARYSFGVALVFLLYCPFLLLANLEWVTEKSAVWTYIFLIVGTTQSLLELKIRKPSRLNNIFNMINSVISNITPLDLFLISLIKKLKRFATFSFQNFIKTLAIFILVIILFLIGFDLYLRAMNYRSRQMMNPSVQLIEPNSCIPWYKGSFVWRSVWR